MQPLRVGIVGTGARGTNCFGRFLVKEEFRSKVTLAALCDINPIRLQAARDILGGNIPGYTDYDAFLREPALDGVIVATPCHTHAELTIRALQAGKHVLCEKAMATTAPDCYRMVKAEQASGKVLMLGLCLRYTDVMRELIPVVRSGVIGEIISVSVVDTLDNPTHFARWHRLKQYSGGILLQKGTHTLDLVNWILNEKPMTVAGFGGRSLFVARPECRGWRCSACAESRSCPEYNPAAQNEMCQRLYFAAEKADGYFLDRCVYDPEIDIMDHATLALEYTHGKRAHYTLCLFGAYHDRKFTIIGAKGIIEVSRDKEEFTVFPRKRKDTIHYKLEGHGEGFTDELNDFIMAMATGRKPIADSEAGLWSVLAGLAGETAIAQRRLVAIKALQAE